ncbi:MAG: hypothetical protein CMF75_00235 [Maricaulis sp.]|nr:hypothetical protein [Maricaulis sp.]
MMMANWIKHTRQAGLAGLAVFASAAAAQAQATPSGHSFFWELQDASALIGWSIVFEPDGSVTKQTSYIYHDGTPNQDQGPDPIGQWSLGSDGSVSVDWLHDAATHCDAWPAYAPGSLDAVPDGDCWLPDEIRTYISEGAIGGFDG